MSATAAAASLLVLTLNVSGPRRVHQGWPTRLEAITTRLKSEAPEAAAFQEVWRTADLDALKDAAGTPHAAFDEKLGLAVASRAPIESSASKELGGGYGVLRARLRVDKGEVDVYSARLEPGEGDADARRLGQLFRLAEFIRVESSTRPYVLLGDLGVPSDEPQVNLLLDLLEARDLCVAHGDEVCGRTQGDKRVDFALIPYSSRLPKDNARATLTDLISNDDEEPMALHFGLTARLDANFLKTRPAAHPAGRDEALDAIGAAVEKAREAEERRQQNLGWIPFLGARRFSAAQDQVAAFAALEEEVRTALLRDAKRETPRADE